MFFWFQRSLQLYLQNHYLYKDLARLPEKRGMVLGRNGMIAAHRYPVLYAGKSTVSWKTLKALPFFNGNIIRIVHTKYAGLYYNESENLNL